MGRQPSRRSPTRKRGRAARLDRGDADLAVALGEVQVADREQRAGHVHRQPEAGAGAEVADVHVAAVLARRVGAQAVGGGGRPGQLGRGRVGGADRRLARAGALEQLPRRRHADRAGVHAGRDRHAGQLLGAGVGAVELPAGEEGALEQVAEEARAGPDRGPAEVVGLVGEHLELEHVARLGAGHLERAGQRVGDRRRAEQVLVVDSRPSWRSRESRSSKVTSSPGSTRRPARAPGASGCARAAPSWTGTERSISMRSCRKSASFRADGLAQSQHAQCGESRRRE